MLVNSKQMWEKVGHGEANVFIENYHKTPCHKTKVFIVKYKDTLRNKYLIHNTSEDM